MGLSSIVSKAGLGSYAEIALLIFLAVFVAVTVHTLRKKREAEFEHASRLPLDDAAPFEADAKEKHRCA
jgi:cbb3-type cytochrome oxidase subunit 3